MSTTEPRALTAALQSPAFVTKGGGLAMHVANRHVERWAPEEGAHRIRPLRNLGFVDRLVSPWIESAQRSASLRMFNQYIANGVAERAPTTNVSWVFPRPWYQDELDWMAAARTVGTQTALQQESAPSMLTTRGTYVAPAHAAAQLALPTALHEYVAPSLSLARPDVRTMGEVFSPLVPFAAAQAAHVMARAVAPLGGDAARMSPGLRAVLATMLDRATQELAPTRTSMRAPELVTPPAPRAPIAGEPAIQIADQYAEQHAQVADLQRMARVAAEHELAARAAATAPTQAQLDEIRAAQARAVEQRQAELQRRLGHREPAGAGRDDSTQERAAAERARIEQRIAARLHEQSREAAARDARAAATATEARPAERLASPAAENRVAAQIAAAVAALPPELATMVTAGISARPEHAVQAIAELGDALRSVELIARNSAAGGTIESTRGPRLVMPAGLGGLVSTIEHTTAGAQPRMPIASIASVASVAMPAAAAAAMPAPRVPAMPFIQSRAVSAAPTSALGAATTAMPAALSHVAWSDRWLARFAGARPQSLEVLAAAASPESRMQILAAAAPNAVFVAPMFEDRSAQQAARGGETGFDVSFAGARTQDVLPTLRGGPAPEQPVLRFADDAEVPDDMLAAIAISAARSRAAVVAPPAAPKPTLPTVDPDRYQPRDTLADLVAHGAPAAPGAGLSAQLASSPLAPALRHVLSLGIAPSFDVRALFGASLASAYLAGLIAADTSELSIAAPLTRAAVDFEPTYVAPERPVADDAGELPSYAEPLTTLRSALLSFDVASGGEPLAQTVTATVSAPLARTMTEAMALPMLGSMDVGGAAFGDADATTYAAPGMIAERAQAWSVAQERSSSDLAFDFVTPELVLAARVYGLGPAEAAQAARLAVGGPGHLSAMAGAVDRTFVQAMAIEAERRGERTITAYPVSGDASSATTFAPSRTAFGVERRAPRGAFLWPAATTGALGMNAAAPDGDHSMSVAALELLAARAVAELGTYTALSGERAAIGTPSTGAAPAEARDEDVLEQASALVPAERSGQEAGPLGPMTRGRRDKFQALYVALSGSTSGPSGRTASPAARAVRALALAGRGEETVSARERAMVAWDVLPVVYGDAGDEPLSTGDAAARAVRRRDELRALDPIFVDSRPGLASLSARAGEALGSYVASPAPAAPSSSSSSSSSREVGAVLRPPTAAPEFVQTGRPSGRTGGGEVEIPAWFEQAARKMFESKSGISDGISIAELTLVTAAPAPQVAASTRVAGGAPPVAVAPAAAVGAEKQAIDIEKLANDVYREVLVLMDIARARNGEPYL